MYIVPEILDNVLEKQGLQWPSPSHKVVAQNALLSNRLITRMDDLIRCLKIIVEIPADNIQAINYEDLSKLGVPY